MPTEAARRAGVCPGWVMTRETMVSWRAKRLARLTVEPLGDQPISSQEGPLPDSNGSASVSSWLPTFWWNRLAIIWYAIALGMPSLVSDLTSSAITLSRAASMAARTSSIVAVFLTMDRQFYRTIGGPNPALDRTLDLDRIEGL